MVAGEASSALTDLVAIMADSCTFNCCPAKRMWEKAMSAARTN